MIGKFIKEKRMEKGLSSRGLAEKSGVSQAYISQLENGHFENPSIDVLRKLAAPLGIDSLDVLGAAGYIVEDEVAKQKEMKQNLFTQFDNLVKDGGFYLTDDNKGILTKMKSLDEHGFFSEEKTQKQNENIKIERPVIHAQNDILFNLKSNPNVSLNLKPLKDEDKQKMTNLLKAAFPEYFD